MKQSKNLGINKACPHCKKTIIKSVNMLGQGNFDTKCNHCQALVHIEVGQKAFITLTKILPI